jgi:prepilin-type processing-associated H-X9-DG protein
MPETLDTWDTHGLPDDDYDLEFVAEDTLGLSSTQIVTVEVDNSFPPGSMTSPVDLDDTAGGVVYSSEGDAWLGVPPGALTSGQSVRLAPRVVDPPLDVGVPMPALSRTYGASWKTVPLRRPATLTLRATSSASAPGEPTLYHRGSGGQWSAVGGTFDRATATLSATIADSGSYVLVHSARAESAPVPGLTFSPRVISAGESERISISFGLERASAVTALIYNRAGRLTRRLADGLALGAGANVLFWDGRSEDGAPAEPGLYLVHVRTPGRDYQGTIAVTR